MEEEKEESAWVLLRLLQLLLPLLLVLPLPMMLL